jgi:hypothetical protein
MMRASHVMKFGKLTTIVERNCSMHDDSPMFKAWALVADAIAGHGRPEAIIAAGRALVDTMDTRCNMSDFDRITIKRLINELSQ